jgi:signal transduction histidine kinase
MDEALDHMWVEIKESKDEIVDLNKSLEEIVDERTSQLEKANRKLKDTLDELKTTQEKLIQSEKSAALAGMVAGVAHEINTPIGLCITAVSYLEEANKELSESYNNGALKKTDLEKFMNIVDETTKSTLINLNKASDLVRSFKQVAADQSSEEERTFYLKHYIQDVLLSLRPELKKWNCSIQINCDDKLTIKSYPGAFSQIITNLVMNTLIHGYNAGETVKINFNVTKGNGNLLFEYSDEGMGIKKDIQDKIFDPFFTTKRGNGGTGLGLNIVFNLVVNNLNGTIKCESEEGNGAAFIINIPVSE